ncbi:MAG: SulP family inorganic anion transporter [Myxococcota bacterium]
MFARLFPDLAAYRPAFLGRDFIAALAVSFLAVPQGIAYAMIAGLDPAIGLYAGAIPTIIASLVRSSTHVMSGPTNAVSLLVGTAVAASATDDPTTAALLLATMVGVIQIGAGVLKLGALVDYISTAVVAGYITGAATLIGIGQLKNLTGTDGESGAVYNQVWTWISGLSETNGWSIVIGLSTAAAILLLRLIPKRPPAAIVVLGLGVLLSWLLALDQYGVRLIRDIAPVPVGLPPLTLPTTADLALMPGLLPIAAAAAVLSLVESSAVGRSIASRTGQRLSSDREFIGQGLSNLSAGFFGGYPVSGSLGRSALAERTGVKSRLAGVMAGLMMIIVLLFLGPAVDLTPVPTLAGLLLVLAWDLIDLKKIRAILSGDLGDKVSFTATLIGTWVLSLDYAIYLGVALSVILFLRRARQLVTKEMVLHNGRFIETNNEIGGGDFPAIRVMHVEGSLFFGAANELRDALDDITADPALQVLILRLKRTSGIDFTTATVLEAVHTRLQSQGRHLFLVGLRPDTMTLLDRVGVADALGRHHLYPSRPGWFAAMDEALTDALVLVNDEDLEAATALQAYLVAREA